MSRPLLGFVLFGLLGILVPSSEVVARDTLRVSVACPESVSRRSVIFREPVQALVTLENRSHSPVHVSKGALLIHAGNDRILGPTPFSVTVDLPGVPGFPFPPCPACTVALPAIPVSIPPVARAGTFVSFGFGFLGSGNQVLGQNHCVIEIAP